MDNTQVQQAQQAFIDHMIALDKQAAQKPKQHTYLPQYDRDHVRTCVAAALEGFRKANILRKANSTQNVD